jgi:hypothetical protein
MKTLKLFAFAVLIVIISSCASTARFPISAITPAADIIVAKTNDRNGNTAIKITAKNLAAVERIEPPKATYVVWIVTEYDGIRNVGMLKSRNSKTAELITVTPFKFTEIFITAEDQSDLSYPSGIEISRVRYSK